MLTDATIRRWCGPRWRIGASRRIRAAAAMAHERALQIEALASGGAGDDIVVEAAGLPRSEYGNLAFLTPIAELDIDRVSAAEADAYRQFRDSYQRRWTRFFDPIAIQVRVGEDGFDADVSVMPLIADSDFREYVELCGDAVIAPGAGDPHDDALLHFVQAIDPNSEPMRELSSFLDGTLVGSRIDPFAWVGDSFSLYIDDDPIWQELAAAEDFDRFAERNFNRFPIAFTVEVEDSFGVAAFLTAMRAFSEQAAPGMLHWGTREHQGMSYVVIRAEQDFFDFDEGDLRLYYSITKERLVVSLDEDLIVRHLDRLLAQRQGEHEARPWLGDSVSFRIRRTRSPRSASSTATGTSARDAMRPGATSRSSTSGSAASPTTTPSSSTPQLPPDPRVPRRRGLRLERAVAVDGVDGLRAAGGPARPQPGAVPARPDRARRARRHVLDDGLVRIDGALERPAYKLRFGELVAVHRRQAAPREAPAEIELSVVHEDEHLAVIDKQAGLTVHPAPGETQPTLIAAVLHRWPELSRIAEDDPDADPLRPGLVHRLDRDTTGLLMIAKTADALRSLQDQLRERTIDKRYLAVTIGAPDPESGLIDAPIGRDPADPRRMAILDRGRSSQTGYETVERFSDAALLSCQLITGRTHQIRVHLAAIGHPIAGDTMYGLPSELIDRQALHAASLSFRHPATDEPVSVEAGPPPDMRRLLSRLREGELLLGDQPMPNRAAGSADTVNRQASARRKRRGRRRSQRIR